MPIVNRLLHSTTSGNKPAALVSGQLAINEADRALYYLDPQTGAPSPLLDQVGALAAPSNLIINGAMEIDQINRGTLVSAINGYAVDMVRVTKSGTHVLTSQQVADAPPGFSKSLKIAVTTGNASPGSTDFASILFPIDGYRIQRLGWGAPGALSMTIGFWVKAFRAGAYGVNVSSSVGNRGYSTTFTIATSAVWQWITVTIPGDVTGTWPVTNVRSLNVSIFMMAGSGLLMTPNSWTAGGAQGVSGQVNGVQSISDTMQITGMSALPGYVAPTAARSFILQPSFAEALISCQRFWQKSYEYETAVATVTQVSAHEHLGTGPGSAVNVGMAVRLLTAMAATPSVTIISSGTGASAKVYDNVNTVDLAAAVTVKAAGQNGFTCQVTAIVNATIDYSFHWTADARM